MAHLSRPNANEATQTTNRSRDFSPSSGLCTRCIDGCKGNCEVWQSTFRGREVLYPGPYGTLTAGADKDYPVDYSHFNIHGYALGADGLPEGTVAGPDNTLFTMVNTDLEIGYIHREKLRMPIISGALGSTDVARVNWEHFAVGAAISGIVLTCGENVCGIDPGLQLDDKGKIVESPELRRRVEIYRRYYEGYGDIHVQM
ncbi:MAG: FMN-binding glutamate synthase family protein, partial [Chloroflexi bacterium]|nr:FMN-binding glutamate synthase family protein [Chloroflexota bacterium]